MRWNDGTRPYVLLGSLWPDAKNTGICRRNVCATYYRDQLNFITPGNIGRVRLVLFVCRTELTARQSRLATSAVRFSVTLAERVCGSKKSGIRDLSLIGGLRAIGSLHLALALIHSTFDQMRKLARFNGCG